MEVTWRDGRYSHVYHDSVQNSPDTIRTVKFVDLMESVRGVEFFVRV